MPKIDSRADPSPRTGVLVEHFTVSPTLARSCPGRPENRVKRRLRLSQCSHSLHSTMVTEIMEMGTKKKTYVEDSTNRFGRSA